MHVKLLQTTFSDSHRLRRGAARCGGPSRVLDASLQFPKFLQISQSVPLHRSHAIALISFPFSETTSGEIRLWLMQPSFLRDRPHACAVPNQSSARKREISFESLLLFSMRRESIRITCAATLIFLLRVTPMCPRHLVATSGCH